jgi:multidrug efflux pump subunit AcrA (membrane-fusion protein)
MTESKSWLVEFARIVTPLIVLAGGALVAVAIFFSRKPPTPEEQPITAPAVDTTVVEVHQGDLDIQVDGTVVPHREINLSAEVSGRIITKTDDCRAGRYVTAGTLLVQIDPRNYDLELQRLEREVEQADVSVQEMDVDIENTKKLVKLASEDTLLQQRQLERLTQLRARDAVSEAAVDEGRRAELASRNALVQLQNQLRAQQTARSRLQSAQALAMAKREEAQLNLERTKVVAPIDGMIVAESVQQDDFVQAGAKLVTVQDTSAAEVRCMLRMDELAWLWLSEEAQPASAGASDEEILAQRDWQLPKTPVTVCYTLGDQQYCWDGYLNRFEGVGLDEKTRTVPCRVLVPEPRQVKINGHASALPEAGPRALLRGMYVKVTIHATPPTALLVVPERSVQPGNVVWRVRDGKLNIVSLKNVRPLDDAIVVPSSSSDLRPGDQIVITPLAVAREGMAVQVKQPTVAADDKLGMEELTRR